MKREAETGGKQRRERRSRPPHPTLGEQGLPRGLRRECGPDGTLTGGSRPPELCRDGFLLFQVAQFVAVCCGSPRKLVMCVR